MREALASGKKCRFRVCWMCQGDDACGWDSAGLLALLLRRAGMAQGGPLTLQRDSPSDFAGTLWADGESLSIRLTWHDDIVLFSCPAMKVGFYLDFPCAGKRDHGLLTPRVDSGRGRMTGVGPSGRSRWITTMLSR